ncbi:MAG: carbohydrate-binding domain-containing protein [Bacilli bacterium]|nr:carbohydrate-binding domain-containing protein [Bacilli bacterium]
MKHTKLLIVAAASLMGLATSCSALQGNVFPGGNANNGGNATYSNVEIDYDGDDVSVTGVSLNYSSLSIAAGSSAQLNVTIVPYNATNLAVTWTSSDESVATVANGKVTGVSEGSATITVTTADGSYKATCKVSVTKSSGTTASEEDSDSYVPDAGDASILVITAPSDNADGYVISGSQYKQIYVNAPDQKIEISLEGATLTNSENSPIFIADADKVEISAQSGTKNYIYDKRSAYTEDVDGQGKGAIYVENGDLTIKGKGELYIDADYYNGVHGKDDVDVKNLTLGINALNHGIRGNDSVTVKSGAIDIVCGGDGLKTSNSDISSKGNQRGDVTVSGGDVTINSYGDGIDASYNAVVEQADSSVPTSLTIKTNTYSSYSSSSRSAYAGPGGHGGGNQGGPGGNQGGPGGMSGGASNKAADSAKGIKSANQVMINGGTIDIKAYDDGIHANKDETLENGYAPLGNVTFSGGSTSIYASDDGVHADQTVYIKGGTLNVTGSYEGVEGNLIDVSGGTTTVLASDDGLNANSGSYTPNITVSGGRLDVCVPTSGDTDGIDSNGTYTQTGGVVFVCGPGSAGGSYGGGAFAIDTESTIAFKGGTIGVFGGIERTPSTSGMTKSSSSSTVSAGSKTITAGKESYTFNLKYSTSGYAIYSDQGSASVK